MNTWILILVLSGWSDGGQSMHSIEFKDKHACLIAAKEFQAKVVTGGASQSAICVRKSSDGGGED